MSRRSPNLDDLANEARYNDSLTASRARRREVKKADILMRLALVAVLAVIVWFGIVVFASAAGASSTYTPQQQAFSAAKDYIAPLTRPDNGRVDITVIRCHDLGFWYGCRVRVVGRTTCNGVLRVREPKSFPGTYLAWMPWVNCHS